MNEKPHGPQCEAPRTGQTLLGRAWPWARRNPIIVGLLIAMLLVGDAIVVGMVLRIRRANAEAASARADSRRAESALWNANFNAARALRTSRGTGTRLQSSALLKNLLRHPNLTEAQILKLRQEAIAQMALIDIAMPTNWISKASDKNWAWNHTLDVYARDTGTERVDLCEFPSERVLASFSGPPNATFDQGVISRDNQFLAVRFSNAGGVVRVWNVATHDLVLETTSTELIEISPDSRTLLLLTSEGITVQALSVDSQARLLEPARGARKAVFSSDSKWIAVLPANRNWVEIWDADSGENRLSFNMSFNPHQIAWHPHGTHLLMGGARGQLEMRVLAGGQGSDYVSAPIPLSGHVAEIRHITFTPDGSTAMTYGWDHSSIAWDVSSGRSLLRDPHRIVGSSSNEDRLIVRRENPLTESVATLIPRTGFRTVASAGGARFTEGLWTSPDGRLGVVNHGSASASIEGDCLLWDFRSGVEIARLKGVWAQFSADSGTLFTFERFAANRVRRYDVSAETLAARPSGWSEGSVVYQGRRGENVNTGSISADGHTLAIAATDTVILVDITGKNSIRSWRAPAHTVSLSNDGKWAATTRHHSPSMLRRAQNGEAVLSLPRYSRVRFSPDSRWMAVATPDSAQMYDLETLLPAYSVVASDSGSGATPALEFSRDSRMFAVSYDQTEVRLHETTTGRELATLSPPNPAPILGSKSLEFSVDGQWLLAARNDGETIAWHLPVIRGELAKLGLNWKDRE